MLGITGVMERLAGHGGGAEIGRALEMARESGDVMSLSIVLEQAAYLAAVAGDFEASRERYLEAARVLDDLPDPSAVHPFELARRRYFTTMSLGNADRRLGRTDDALAAYHEGLRIAEQTGNLLWQAHAHYDIGELFLALGRRAEARPHLRTARSAYQADPLSVDLRRVEALLRQVEDGPDVS